MSLKSRQKSVADSGADEHLVALPPNRSAMRLPRTGPAGCEPETHAGAGSSGRLLLCLSGFSKSHEHSGTLCTSRLASDCIGGGIQVLLSKSQQRKKDLCTTLRQA